MTLFIAVSGYAQPLRTALVIGNSDYRYLPKLTTPINDAQQLALTLSSLGFQVYLATDLNTKDYKNTLRHYADTAQEAEISLVYFAGYNQVVKGQNITYALDARPSVRPLAAGFSFDKIIRDLSAFKRLDLFLIDAYKEPDITKNAFHTFQIEHALPENSLLMFSNSWGQNAHGRHTRHSIFTAALLDQIISPNRPISTVLDAVKNSVLKNSNGMQQPSIQSNLQFDPILRSVVPFIDHMGEYYRPIAPIKVQNHNIGLKNMPILLDLAHPNMIGSFLNRSNTLEN